MRFRSTNAPELMSSDTTVSFKDAVLSCLPNDGGLYVPDKVKDIRQFFLYMDEQTSFSDLVSTVAPSLLEGEFNPLSASRTTDSAFDFTPEIIRLDDDFSILNLYNGPTGLYKDFGIAFLAAVLDVLRKDHSPLLVLAAARGDTGISIARAFTGRKGINVVLVYPTGPVRGLDPAGFVPNGGNIIPIQIRGTFDDCQRLVNETIRDKSFSARYSITSANAINPGRLLPQVFYYLYAFTRIKKQLSGDLAFSVPCGNFGNFIAGLYAWKFGMPVNGFVAAMNANNALGGFFGGRDFVQGPPVKTNSPALDVSIPSNLSRLESFYREAPAVMRNIAYPASIGDDFVLKTIERVWKKYHLPVDPHTAVAFAAAEQTAADHAWKGHTHTIVLATGHYAKYADLIRKATGQTVTVPESFKSLRKKVDPIALIPPQLDAFENAIASCYSL
ncbi:MAG: threonine synthase [Treponema sp.]|nr:threonine synthase [Treponema sp.]